MKAREKCAEVYGKTTADGVIDLFLRNVWHDRSDEPPVGSKILTYTRWGGELKILQGTFLGGRLLKAGSGRPWVITGKWAYAEEIIPEKVNFYNHTTQ